MGGYGHLISHIYMLDSIRASIMQGAAFRMAWHGMALLQKLDLGISTVIVCQD